jgi:hypothetical protein
MHNMSELTIELSGSKDLGPCECCGGDSRTVWGFVHSRRGPEAAYFVQWTLGHVDQHGANFDLIVGKWGTGADRADRCAVSLEFRRTEQDPSFMVIDSASRPVATSDLVGRSLARSEVIGSPLAKTAFDIVDAIWLQDKRIAEIVGAA